MRQLAAALKRPKLASAAKWAFAAALIHLAAIPTTPQFKVTSDLVLVDVVVLDRKGQPVRGLKQSDFQVFEDGKLQTMRLFRFHDISAQQQQAVAVEPGEKQVIRVVPPSVGQPPPDMDAARDRRLIFLFFDSSALPPEDFIRARDTAKEFLTAKMTAADLVAVGVVGNTVRIVENFTNDRDALVKSMERIIPGEAAALAGEPTAVADPSVALPTDPNVDPNADPSEEDPAFTPDETELNIFNTDRQLGAIEMLARKLRDIPGRKMMVYFSNGIATTGMDNQSQLRATVDSANRANLSIYTVDTRGLQAMVPGGDARAEFTRGSALFSGVAQRRQRDRQLNSQDTIYTLAEDTGGKALLDSNDLGQVFDQIQRDSVGYYLLGYYTQNAAADGKFRRLKVVVNAAGARVRHRPGYFAPKEFKLYTREERDTQMREALGADMPFLDIRMATEVDLSLRPDKQVLASVSLKVPASQLELPEEGAAQQLEFDVLGEARFLDGRPAAVLKDTIKLKWTADAAARLKAGGLQYSGGFPLRPGQYKMKLLLRDNRSGRLGTFEHDLAVPDLNSGLTLSSVVLGSTSQGDQVVPSVTRVFRPTQDLLVSFHAYNSAQSPVTAALVLFRNGRKVRETMVAPSGRPDSKRPGIPFRLRLPLKDFAPGRYVAQVNALDPAAPKAGFARVPFAVVAP